MKICAVRKKGPNASSKVYFSKRDRLCGAAHNSTGSVVISMKNMPTLRPITITAQTARVISGLQVKTTE